MHKSHGQLTRRMYGLLVGFVWRLFSRW